jgi:hypothetical protein
MKTLLTILFVTLCAATSYGQTMKALMFNASNNQVVASTGTNNLTFTNNVNLPSGSLLRFNSGASHIDETGFYATQYGSFFSFEEQRLRMNDANVFEWDANGVVTFGNAPATRTNLGLGANFLTNANVTNFRSAIGLGLPALTNTSNVTIMRALAGSANTNQPFSGTFITYDTTDIYTVTVSNGIIISVNVQ